MADNDTGYLKQSASVDASAREAQCLNAVRGPRIVDLRNTGDDGEFVLARAACSLADVLHERGPLPDDEVRAVAAGVAAALVRVHEAGLVHGDVKPANLLLSSGEELWLADFDSAAVADGQPLESYSPGRLPPGAPARPETDIAALAVSLVELSTGMLVDPEVQWRAGDLRRLGCSPALSAEISFLMGAPGSVPTARAAAAIFERGGPTSLPAPAATVRLFDPTPTVDFMPARAGPPQYTAARSPEAGGPSPPWWKGLATSWARR